jgi:hypothetical protein
VFRAMVLAEQLKRMRCLRTLTWGEKCEWRSLAGRLVCNAHEKENLRNVEQTRNSPRHTVPKAHGSTGLSPTGFAPQNSLALRQHATRGGSSLPAHSASMRGLLNMAYATPSSLILVSAHVPNSPKYPSGSWPRHSRSANQMWRASFPDRIARS